MRMATRSFIQESVSDIPELNDLLTETMNTPDGLKPIRQLFVFDAQKMGRGALDLSQDQMRLFALAELFYDDTVHVHMSLNFDDAVVANDWLKTIETNLKDDQELIERFARNGIEVGSPRTTVGAHGNSVIVLPLHRSADFEEKDEAQSFIGDVYKLLLLSKLNWFIP